MNLELQIRLEDHSAKTTIFWQAVAGILCIILGGGIIYLLTGWANKFEIYWPDNEKHSFFIGAMVSSVGLIFLVVYVTKKQFEKSLVSTDVFFSSIRYAFFVWLYAAILYSILVTEITV
ncbi:MAG: hypothetical protein GY942_00535 [Aestuariibacter sp.]|nr:hypothetical protein [Aestuariibacter sp.]